MTPATTLQSLLLLAILAAGASAQEPASARSGLTGLLSFGVGLQRDQSIRSTETGLGGLNLGVGAFLTDRAALMLRASGTNVARASKRHVSGTAGISLQYWIHDRLRLEAGAGVGVLEILGSAGLEGLEVDPKRDSGFGLIFGTAFTLWRSVGHDFSIGLEYAPAFTDPDTVHNFGIVLGWQRF